MKEVNYPVIVGKTFLTLIADKAYSITTSDTRWAKALDAVKRKAWNEFFTLMDKPAAIARYSKGRVKVYNDEVHYNDQPVHGVIAERILKFMNEGFDFAPLVAFLDNLYLNMDKDIREKLYLFLENNQLAITERGSFLAFKLTKSDGSPYYGYKGEFLNEDGDWVSKYEVGKKFFFPKDRIVKTSGECSTEGLYVGNKNYWNGSFDAENNYTGDGLMFIVEVYPQHVCNVPHADATKIVVCELNVIDQYKTIVKEANSSFFGNLDAVKMADDFETATDWVDDLDGIDLDDELVSTSKLPKRDAKGKFVKKVAPKRDSKGRFIAKKSNKKAKRDSKGRFTS